MFVYGQECCQHQLKGRVLDIETNEPVPYVHIKIDGVKGHFYTDTSGYFVIKDLCTANNTVRCSCVGYRDTLCNADRGYIEFKIQQDIYIIENGAELRVKAAKKKSTVSIAQEEIVLESEENISTLAEAIEKVDGVTFTSVGNNVQLPVIHGLYGNRVLVLNNGLKHGFQNWGSEHAPEIDISDMHSITVIKGAGGVRFGPEALGGAIVIDPNPLYFKKKIHGNIGAGYQSNGQGYLGKASFGQGLKNFAYHIGGSYQKVGDLSSPDYSLTNTGKEEYSLNTGVRYKIKSFDTKLYYSLVNQDLGLLRSSVAESANLFINSLNADEPIIIKPFSYEINEPKQLTQHHLAKFELRWWQSEKSDFVLKVGKQFNFRQEYDVRRNANKPIIDLDLTTDDYQLEWNHKFDVHLSGTVGGQIFEQTNINNPGTGVTAFIPNYKSTRYSLFAIENWKEGRNTFEFGARGDYESSYVSGREPNQDIFRDDFAFQNFTSSLGWVRYVSDSIIFRTNIGTAWRMPNMAELYSFGQHGFKNTYGLLRYYEDNGRLRTDRIATAEGNISPEKCYKWVNELDIQQKKNRFKFTLYTHYIQNYIFEKPIAVLETFRGPMPFFAINQADALFAGMDATWKHSWVEKMKGTFGLSYLWSRNIACQEALINQPPIQLNYSLDWELPQFGKLKSSLEINPSYTFRQFNAPRVVTVEQLIEQSVEVDTNSEIFDFMEAPSGYFLLNVTWKYAINEKIIGSIALKNALNTKYRNYLNEMRYFADEQGINILLSINYKF
ncbi:MAG: TonB-dependent receptor [Cytophagales bacterium]|nr:TonB-dependent receptor [Cytophagales bacterium]